MKKIAILLVLAVTISMGVSAQNKARTTAYNYLRKGKLDLAKENIDKAVEHEKTMNDPKTWFYYGNTYIQLATTSDEAYKNLDEDALRKAFEGYKKCMELDEKGTYKVQILQDMVVISNNYYSRGLENYNAEDFEKAYGQFNQAINVNNAINNLDTLAIYAAAMSAYSAKMIPEAISDYEELVDLGYNNSTIYGDLANIYKDQGDIEKAKEVLQKGIDKYPNDPNVLFAKINILLSEEKYAEVINSLDAAIQLAPDNYTLFFVQGQSYEEMDNLEQAEISYQKAIEINPEYGDALFNLGALHYNKAVDIYARANELPLDATDKYDEMAAEANKSFLDAQPYFERALELSPGDVNLTNSLRQIYNKTKQTDKLGELNNK